MINLSGLGGGVTLFLMAACSSAGAATSGKAKETTFSASASTPATTASLPLGTVTTTTAQVRIPVSGMSCAACVAQVRKTLQGVNGVEDVTVSLADQEARVRFQPGKVDSKWLVQTINDLGYQAGSPLPGEKE